MFELQKSELHSDQEWLLKILAAHPRLGAPKKDELSSHSAGEQKGLQGSEEEREKLRVLNEEYEERFPGMLTFYFLFYILLPASLPLFQYQTSSTK